jgi:hypothetical protein
MRFDWLSMRRGDSSIVVSVPRSRRIPGSRSVHRCRRDIGRSTLKGSFKYGSRLRPCKQESLRLVTTLVAQKRCLLPGLHPFRDHGQPKAMRHGDQGADEHDQFGIVRKAANETLIDFDRSTVVR